MMRFTMFLVLLTGLQCFGQGPTFQSNHKDWWVSGGLVLSASGSTWARYSGRGYDPSNLPLFDANEVNAFDRRAIGNWSPQADHASDILGLASPILPALLLLDKNNRVEFEAVGHMYAQTALLTLSLTDFTKTIVKRDRPFLYADNASLSQKSEPTARYSFFSGHTSMTASQCFLTAKMFSEFYPDSPNRKYIWAAAALYPAAVGYFRVKAGKHFPTDVIVGYIVGGIVGYLVPHFHLSRRHHD